MILKNIIPYYIAHQFFEYNSKYIDLIRKGYLEEVKKSIIENDFYLNELNIVYYWSINYKQTEILKFFDEKKIKINKQKKEFVYESAKMNNVEIVKEYLYKKKPSEKNKFLFLLLKIATLHNSKETVEILLKYGTDFKQENYTVIREVLFSNNFELFKLYHKYGLDINKDEYIYRAVLKDNKDWFYYLINHGFEINQKNKEKIYTLMGFNGSIQIIEEEKNNIIYDKELMLNSSRYNPLAKKWLESFYKKVDFYKKLEEKLPPKEKIENKKIKKL